MGEYTGDIAENNTNYNFITIPNNFNNIIRSIEDIDKQILVVVPQGEGLWLIPYISFVENDEIGKEIINSKQINTLLSKNKVGKLGTVPCFTYRPTQN